MALRLLEVTIPADEVKTAREILDADPAARDWHEWPGDGQMHLRVLLDAEETGDLVDALNDRLGQLPGFQVLICAVEAAIPAREPTVAPDPDPDCPAPSRVASGLSREELHDDFVDLTKVSRVFVIMVVLSTIVATIGVMRGSVAVIIGAMVIAPLLGPNVALAFATTLGDVALIRRSLVSNLIGVAIALAITVAVGLIVPFDATAPEIASRTALHPTDLLLALAAGSAGALALTSGISSTLVGVMVAVALLPPTAVLGLMLGTGDWSRAVQALLLLSTNVIGVNLAGVVTFLVQGVRPRGWWEADRARRSSRIALVLWIGLLAVLVVLVVTSMNKSGA
jgi:uncharacterized hydrophobic protein (TIGR00341 family)